MNVYAISIECMNEFAAIMPIAYLDLVQAGTEQERLEAVQVEACKRYKDYTPSDYMVYTLTVRYTHRNGEEDLPTQQGWYWGVRERVFPIGIHIAFGYPSPNGWVWYDPDGDMPSGPGTRYYGPIPHPTMPEVPHG